MEIEAGTLLSYGRDGVGKDLERAKMLLESSAIQGNELAKKRLLELADATAEPQKAPVVLEKNEK